MLPVTYGYARASKSDCSDYDSDDYHYSPSVEPKIVDVQGGIYGPYTGSWFDNIRENRHRAHRGPLRGPRQRPVRSQSRYPRPVRVRPAEFDLGIPQRQPAPEGRQRRSRVATRPEPLLVRGTGGAGASGVWTHHRPGEADAIDTVLAGCESTEMVVLAPRASATTTATPGPTATATPTQIPTAATDMDALAMYDDNGNGRITCAGPGPTASRPFTGDIRRTSSCGTRTETEWCVNSRPFMRNGFPDLDPMESA